MGFHRNHPNFIATNDQGRSANDQRIPEQGSADQDPGGASLCAGTAGDNTAPPRPRHREGGRARVCSRASSAASVSAPHSGGAAAVRPGPGPGPGVPRARNARAGEPQGWVGWVWHQRRLSGMESRAVHWDAGEEVPGGVRGTTSGNFFWAGGTPIGKDPQGIEVVSTLPGHRGIKELGQSSGETALFPPLPPRQPRRAPQMWRGNGGFVPRPPALQRTNGNNIQKSKYAATPSQNLSFGHVG